MDQRIGDTFMDLATGDIAKVDTTPQHPTESGCSCIMVARKDSPTLLLPWLALGLFLFWRRKKR